jgi:MYXO-CTERM domain-containing protein
MLARIAAAVEIGCAVAAPPHASGMRFASVLALALALPSAASAQTLFDDSMIGGGPRTSALSLGPLERFAKPFVPTASGVVTSFTLEAAGVVGIGTGTFTMELHDDAGGDPGALLGAGTATRSPDAGPGSVTVAIGGAPAVVAGTTYHAVFYANAGNWMAWYHSATATEGVRASSDGGASWSAATGLDLRRPGLRVTGAAPGPIGTACTGPALCTSGFCADGVCCAVECGGGAMDCMACSVAAGGTTDGACTALRAGAASTIACRPIAGACDAVEACMAGSTACPPDVFASAGTPCRPAGRACDAAEACDGTGAACPADLDAPDGAPCGDGLGCNGEEVCAAGACTPGTPVACDDGDACTTDACAEPGTCTATPICDAGAVDADAGDIDADAGEIDADAGEIDADAGPRTDGGLPRSDAGRDAATIDAGGGPPSSSGCSCRAGGAGRGAPFGLLVAASLAAAARRRRE